MRGINRVFIMGHLGHTPELRTTPRGIATCELNIATNRSRKEGEDWVDETEWHRVVLWEQRAETAARYLTKGGAVAVEGRLRTESWDDKQTGQKRQRTVIVGEQLHLLGGGRDRPSPDARPATQQATAPSAAVPEEEIPF